MPGLGTVLADKMKPLRFGLLGTGYFGKNYVRLLQGMEGVELAAIASRTKETLAKFEDSVPTSAMKTTDASAVLKNPDIDCVVIATPPSTHLSFAKGALEKGKHVLVEKPMVKSLDEAKQLSLAAKKSSSTFMVGHQYVYNDYVRYLRSVIKLKSFGGIRYVLGEHLSSPVRGDIGCLWDAGPHHLSIIHYLFDPGNIVEVTGRSVALSKSGFDDFTAATIKFETGLLATLVISWFGPEKIRKMTLVGERKMAVFDDAEEKDKLKLFQDNSGDSGYASPKIPAKEPLRNELEHFISCVRTGEPPLTGIDHGYAVVKWLDKISNALGMKK